MKVPTATTNVYVAVIARVHFTGGIKTLHNARHKKKV